MSNNSMARWALRCAAGASLLVCLGAPVVGADDPAADYATNYATNKAPLAFGPDQTIIDLNKIVEWGPLELEGFPPGAEIVVLRGALDHGSELIVRVPAGYLIPNHNHTSAETYLWLKGDFTYINGEDGQAAKMSGQSFISLPGNAPPHAIQCASTSCVFYLRYPRPFDHKVFPMLETWVPSK